MLSGSRFVQTIYLWDTFSTCPNQFHIYQRKWQMLHQLQSIFLSIRFRLYFFYVMERVSRGGVRGWRSVSHREREKDYGMKIRRKMENVHINMTTFGTQCSKLSLMELNVNLKLNWESFACCCCSAFDCLLRQMVWRGSTDKRERDVSLAKLNRGKWQWYCGAVELHTGSMPKPKITSMLIGAASWSIPC